LVWLCLDNASAPVVRTRTRGQIMSDTMLPRLINLMVVPLL
jgi:hypothetical protein